jgi:hypothetical protein
MAANDVDKGGSFYLQSKVYRAKELLDEYIQEESMKETTDATSTSSASDAEEETKDTSNNDNNKKDSSS